MAEPILIRFMQPLIVGRRAECFELIRRALDDTPAKQVLCDVIWPAMMQIDRLFRDDRVSTAVEQMATRICRTLADQLQAHLPQNSLNGKRVVILCAGTEQEELGAQICADLLQSDGWDVYFVGRMIPHDETLELVGKQSPDALVIFGTAPDDVPDTRQMIELIREVGVCPRMNIVASGGIFNRADGLWQEVGADAFAPTARDLLRTIDGLPPRELKVVRKSIVKQRNRKRKGHVPLAAKLQPASAE